MSNYTNDIKRYLTGEMSPAERHAFEKKALNDPFLAEALEGAEQLTAESFADDVKSLNSEILLQKKPINSRFTWTWRIAAGLLLLSVSTYVIWNLSQSVDHKTPIALEQDADDTPPGEDHKTLASDEVDTMTALNENQAPVPQSVPPSGSAKAERKPLSEEAEPKTEGQRELPAQPAITQVQPLSVPLKSEVQPEEVLKKAAANKPVEITANRDLAEEARMKQAVSRVSGAAVRANRVITGKVTSAEDGSSLPGVNVIIKGSTMGTITDANGNYQLEVSDVQPTLVFSFIGFRSEEVPAGERQEVNAQISMDVAQLSEVVVVGYGTSATGYVTPTVNLANPETGNRAFKQYLETNISYPQEAIANKTEGRVTVEFVVEADGSLTDFTIIRGIGAGCDEELIRLIKEGPAWTPTKKDGVPIRDKARVRLKFTLPK
jgi:TonB family protein